jgi:hypothetical protein
MRQALSLCLRRLPLDARCSSTELAPPQVAALRRALTHLACAAAPPRSSLACAATWPYSLLALAPLPLVRAAVRPCSRSYQLRVG